MREHQKKSTLSPAVWQENQNSLLRGEAVEAEAVIRFETTRLPFGHHGAIQAQAKRRQEAVLLEAW